MDDERRELGILILGLAVAACVIAVAVIGWRGLFVASSERAVGQVTELRAQDYCRRRKNTGFSYSGRSRLDCDTVYTAVVTYEAHDRSRHTIEVEAGTAPGPHQPVTRARLPLHTEVPVRYSAAFPGWALRDSFVDLWQGPMTLAAIPTAGAFGMGVFWVGLVQRRRSGGGSPAPSRPGRSSAGPRPRR